MLSSLLRGFLVTLFLLTCLELLALVMLLLLLLLLLLLFGHRQYSITARPEQASIVCSNGLLSSLPPENVLHGHSPRAAAPLIPTCRGG